MCMIRSKDVTSPHKMHADMLFSPARPEDEICADDLAADATWEQSDFHVLG